VDLKEAQHAEIRQAVADFRLGMEIRSSLNLRVARRVTVILRTGIIGMGVITAVLLVMLIAFNNKLVEMNGVLATMNNKFSSMSKDMGEMQHVLIQMDRNVAYLPAIVGETDNIRDVIAFPKTLKGQCLMTDAPSPVDKDQLDELSLKMQEKQQQT